MNHSNSLFSTLISPISNETRRLLTARWHSLPAGLQTSKQVVGRHWVQCGYITGPTFCSFGCTHCYLPKTANKCPTPSLADIKAQIDANRKMLGPGGNIQITGGDVVDAYLRANRFGELIEIVSYTTRIGLVPMVMTHGQALLEQPKLLEKLVTDGGLRKISIHIDITQAGRHDYPIRDLHHESQLNPLRDAFADLILNTRKKTGKRLIGAQTVTVTRRNIDSIGAIIAWLANRKNNTNAFRTISFQPEADVGRTQTIHKKVTPDNVWSEICKQSGLSLNRHTLLFGHPDCSSLAMLLVGFSDKRFLDLMPPTNTTEQFWPRLIDLFGGVGACGEHAVQSGLKKLLILLRNPGFLATSFKYTINVLSSSHQMGYWMLQLLRGQIGGCKIVMHNFIDENELNNSPSKKVKDRLASCSFRGAVKIENEWQAIPMCLMNARYR